MPQVVRPCLYRFKPIIMCQPCNVHQIGTSDDMEANASTFLVEMHDTAFLLENLAPDSLVLIDELGRG